MGRRSLSISDRSIVPPSCQHANGVGEGVRLGGAEVIIVSVGDSLVGGKVGVEVRLIVGD